MRFVRNYERNKQIEWTFLLILQVFFYLFIKPCRATTTNRYRNFFSEITEIVKDYKRNAIEKHIQTHTINCLKCHVELLPVQNIAKYKPIEAHVKCQNRKNVREQTFTTHKKNVKCFESTATAYTTEWGKKTHKNTARKSQTIEPKWNVILKSSWKPR